MPDPFEQDPYFRAAADLARAEANLQRLRKATEQWLLGPEALPTREMLPTAGEKLLEETRMMLLDTLVEDAFFRKRLRVAQEGQFLLKPFRRPDDDGVLFDMLEAHVQDPTVKVGWDKKGFGLLRRVDRTIERDRQRQQMAHEKQGRTLARYCASAEARRRTALRRWIEEVTKQNQLGKAGP